MSDTSGARVPLYVAAVSKRFDRTVALDGVTFEGRAGEIFGLLGPNGAGKTMAIFFSAGFLQQATADDRQNRMIEILMSSLDPDQLVIGKIIGLSGAGLLQLVVYVGLLIVPGMTFLAIFQVPIANLALSSSTSRLATRCSRA
jgi:energy-coupling factor transporter ATP-binding protein EcfA2